MGAGTNFEQPNISDDEEVGRNADRHLRQSTAILSWLHIFSPRTLLSTSLYERLGSDRVLPTTDPITPLSTASRSTLTVGIKSDLSHQWRSNIFKAESTWSACANQKAFSSIAAEILTFSRILWKQERRPGKCLRSGPLFSLPQSLGGFGSPL